MVAHSAIDHTGLTGVGTGANPIAYTFMTADSTSSLMTFANVSGMSFALAASSRYFFEYFLNWNANADTVGIRLAVNAADGGTAIALHSEVQTAPSSNDVNTARGVTFSKDTASFATTSGSTTRAMAHVWGWVTTTTNADTLQLRHASETATLTTIYSGSVGRLTKLA